MHWAHVSIILAVALWTAPDPARSADCTVAEQDRVKGYSGLSVKVDSGAAQVGQPIKVSWALEQSSRDLAAPAYLIVAAPSAVRFDGKGFFGLTSQAASPTGIAFGAGRARAVAPLHTIFANRRGTIEVLPLVAVPLDLEWAVVGIDRCGEWVLYRASSGSIPISAGTPQIAVRDEHSAVPPASIIRALDAPFEVRAFEDRIEVHDTATASLLLKRQGAEPAFSPTGRFLTLKTPVEQTYEVLDLVALRLIGRFEAAAFAFSHGDSFLYVEAALNGTMSVVKTMHGARHSLSGDGPEANIMQKYEKDNDESQTKQKQSDRKPKNSGKQKADDREAVTPGTPYRKSGTPPAGPDIELDNFDARTMGAFDHGASAWMFDMSVEHGYIAFRAKNVINKIVVRDGPIDVYDLATAAASRSWPNTAKGTAAIAQAFGSALPKLAYWADQPALWTTVVGQESDLGDTPAGKQVEGRPAGRHIEVGKVAEAKVAIASVGQRRAAITVLEPGSASAETARQVLSGALLHLPHDDIAGQRTGANLAPIAKLEVEIAKVYDAAIALRPSKTALNREREDAYGSAPLPNPAPLRRPKEPALLSLEGDGRIWDWDLGKRRFWLRQSVAAGRVAHVFEFTLLAADPGTKPRWSDLLVEASRAAGYQGTWAREYGPFNQWQLGDVRTDSSPGLEAERAAPRVGISGGRYLTLVMRPTPRIIVFDLSEWKVVCGVANPIDGANAISAVLHARFGHVTQTNADGAVHIYKCPKGELALQGAYVDDELVLLDRRGYYDGSDDAAGYIEIAIPGLPGRHILSQFSRTLRRTGLAEAVLTGDPGDAGPAVLAPPLLTLATLADGKGVRLEAFSTAGLARVHVYGDGRLLRRHAVNGDRMAITLTPADLAQGSTLTAVAVDVKETVSAPVRFTGTAPAKRAARLHALTVGIDEYPGLAGSKLDFAAADARRIAEVAKRSGLYTPGEIHVLTDGIASRAAILDHLGRIVGAAGEDDTVLVSFAAHGLIDSEKRLRLALSGTTRNRLADTSLGFDEVAERLKLSKARVIVLLDVCHAGLADRGEIATNEAAAERLVTSSGAGVVVIAASKGRQFSEEFLQP